MLRVHPALYFAALLLGLLLAYWGISAINQRGPEVSSGGLIFWVLIDLLAVVVVAVLAVMSFLSSDRRFRGDPLTSTQKPEAPRPAAGAGQLTRGAYDWSKQGEAPQRSSGRDPLGRRA